MLLSSAAEGVDKKKTRGEKVCVWGGVSADRRGRKVICGGVVTLGAAH